MKDPYMFLEILLLFIAPFVGLLIGFLPAIGSFIAMISLYPLLIQADTTVTICFYTMMFMSSQFSGSVSAIWFGILGEPTALPVIRERENIIKYNLQLLALRNTSISSVIAVLFSSVLMTFIVICGIENKWLMRSEVIFFISCFVLSFCVFWPYNKWYINAIMIFAGLFIGTIGYDEPSDFEFLTFDISHLYGGLPIITVLLGLYAVPMIIKIASNKEQLIMTSIENSKSNFFSISACLRGCIIGFITGLIPMIGTVICSNITYFIEKKIYKEDNKINIINRLTSVESANNAATISILIPLLLLGLPIQPSEVILYDIIQSNNWHVGLVTKWTLMYLILSLLFAAIISHIICWHLVKPVVFYFYKYYSYTIAIIILLITFNILYIGHQSFQAYYYLIIFVITVFFGLILNRLYDTLPIIMAFMMQNYLYSSTVVILTKYI